ncbi:MAG TPA: 5,10-methylenetetrahydrofolate reductase, partial [Candidatus Omnitrophica bacterium]|nr:5,10-methylenetetrahydrofolate reductase [Candidatus Omnitrophota bacterium]
TGCICPITRCPKGLLNGPCGGVIKGKCEVDRERDCAWVLIYKELEKKGQLDKIKELSKPKDYSKTTKPHKMLVNG